jgi:U1 small nuclear ribonucleoprotein C
MPRFFDDYSNTYLTHDSSAGRKQQRRGWKFRENFRLHYQPYIDSWRRGKMGLAAAQQSFIKVRGVHDPAVPPLPEGWKEELDEVTGITYYIDKVNKTRTWVRPGFIPPPPGGGQRGPPPSFQNRGPQSHPPYQPNNRGQPPPIRPIYGAGTVPPPLNPNIMLPPPPAGTGTVGLPQQQYFSSLPPPPLPPPPLPQQNVPGYPSAGGLLPPPPPMLNLPPPPGAPNV